MRKLFACLLLVALVAGCSKPKQEQQPLLPEPPVSSGPVAPARPAPWRAAPGLSEEQFVREFLTQYAAGAEIAWEDEGGTGPGVYEHQLPRFQAASLRSAANGWEKAGLEARSAPMLPPDYHEHVPLSQYVRRYPFLDTAGARILYLDRTAAPERFAALIHVQPSPAFFYLTFRQEGGRLVPTRLVDTPLHTQRRGPEEDLKLLNLYARGQMDELEGHMLVPLKYLVAHRPDAVGSEPVTELLGGGKALKVLAREGRLLVNGHSLHFDWVRLPDGSYKVISASLTAETDWGVTREAPLPVSLGSASAIQNEQVIRQTAERFLQRWGSGRFAEAEAMAADLKRFYAVSLLSPSATLQWPYYRSFWTLEEEKVRLDHAFDVPSPVDWSQARVSEVYPGAPARARVEFPGTPVTLDIYVAGQDKVSSIALAYGWELGKSGGRQEYLLDRLPRLDEWERGARLLQAVGAGHWSEAAEAAGITEAELIRLMETEALWWAPNRPRDAAGWTELIQREAAGRAAAPAAWPHSWQVRHGQGIELIAQDLKASFAFTGPDGGRRLAMAAIAIGDRSPSLPLGSRVFPGAADYRSTPDLGWALPFPHGDKLLLPPMHYDGPPDTGPLAFYQWVKGEPVKVTDLEAPEGSYWDALRGWKRPGHPEWWVAQVTHGGTPEVLVRIRWEGKQPEILERYPWPEDQGGTFADLNGDGIPESVSWIFPGGDAVVQWWQGGRWQSRSYQKELDWLSPAADTLRGQILWQMPGSLVAVPFRTGVGPGEAVSYPFPFPSERDPLKDESIRVTTGLAWWPKDGQVHWLGSAGIISVQGENVVAAGALDETGRMQVLVAEQVPSALSLYTLEGELIWRHAWPYVMQPGQVTPLTDEGRTDILAYGHPGREVRIHMVIGLRVTGRGPLLLWQSQAQRTWRLSLAVGDADGSPLKDVYLILYGAKGYRGFDVLSDTPTPWGEPRLKHSR